MHTGFNSVEVTGSSGEFTIVNFFSASSGGGSNDSFDPNGYVGPTIYTGTEDHPSFAVGSYNLTGYVSGASETLTITSYTPPSSASIGCNNSVFGDPDPGVGKACFYSLSNTNTPTGPAGYVFCSSESGTCSFAGDGALAYGANGNFLYASFTGGSACTTAAFGGVDPAPWVVKACFYQQASSGRSEVYAGGSHIATYQNGTTYFTHSDWLGTERVRTTVAGGVYSTWTSSPFGEGEAGGNPGPTHFTGKERDAESGLDYFGARYYGSSMGRFMSPDWSDDPDPIPNADTSNPQSLNRYSYVQNNPLTNTDPDGHTCQTNSSDGNVYDDGDGQGCATVDQQNADYAKSGQASATVYAYPSGGFDPGSLAAGVFGPASASTWNNAAGSVNAVAGLEMNIMAPWAAAAAQCTTPGSTRAGCATSMALSVLPDGLGKLGSLGLLAKEEKAIAGVLKQIVSGTTKGKAFENFAGSLPAQAAGYYREFTVPLAGESGRGAARLVTGAGGEVFYTADHYATFTRIK